MVSDAIFAHPEKALAPIVLIFDGIVTFWKKHPSNAEYPNSVMLSTDNAFSSSASESA
jgi:hypothetical protein